MIPPLRVVGPLALGIYKIDFYMSVTRLGLHYSRLASQLRQLSDQMYIVHHSGMSKPLETMDVIE